MAQEIDPLHDPRWPELLGRHPSASVFHTPSWLEALKRTYGYQPAVLTTSGPGERLANGLVFCRVHSWLTGRRLVSLPFTDFCEPLADSPDDLQRLLQAFRDLAESEGVRYAELRPLAALPEASAHSFFHHRLDLRPGAYTLFRAFHKASIQRKVRRAERERILTSTGDLNQFYPLMVLTRRRHGLPPQPLAWFRNLLECMGGSADIRIASKEGRPIAGILTLQHGKTLYYKYGASDARFHNLGAMPLLFWDTIRDAAGRGFETLDLGRSDCDNESLAHFKEHLGAARTSLSYWRFPAQQPVSSGAWRMSLMRHVCAHMPDRCLTMLGALLYRHVA